jgi:hypothetical protein
MQHSWTFFSAKMLLGLRMIHVPTFTGNFYLKLHVITHYYKQDKLQNFSILNKF